MNARRWIALVTIGGLWAVAGAVIYSRSTESPGTEPLPGRWLEHADAKERSAYWRKESEWSKQGFTPIGKNQSFRNVINEIPARVQTSIDPSQLQELRDLLYDNLICRSRGDLQCYLQRCVRGRPAAIADSGHRDWISRKLSFFFDTELSETASLDDIFKRFWQQEYAGQNSGKQFKDVAKDALIVIGDVHFIVPPDGSSVPPPEHMFRTEDLKRWTEWSGARRHRSIEMHPGKHSLAEVMKQVDSCKFADVALVIRSQDENTWCWFTRWYLDPLEKRWELFLSMSVCSRRDYEIPL